MTVKLKLKDPITITMDIIDTENYSKKTRADKFRRYNHTLNTIRTQKKVF